MSDPGNPTIARLLQDLRGTSFTVSIVVNGFTFTGQKVVAFENNTVFTVNTAGLVRATPIANILSVDY